MLFISEVERRLVECSQGFDLSYMEEGAYHKYILPALLYADDIVALAGSVSDSQAILDVCSEEGTSLGLSKGRPCFYKLFLISESILTELVEFMYFHLLI